MHNTCLYYNLCVAHLVDLSSFKFNIIHYFPFLSPKGRSFNGSMVCADWTELERRGGNQGQGVGFGGGQQQYGCSICGKMLSTRLTLKRHVEQQHHQPLHSAVCTICQKVFRTLNSLNNHKSIYHRKPKWSTPSSAINS